MIDLKLDEVTHDLIIENNDLQLISDSEQISQNLKIRLGFFKGEWFIDATKGIPYYTDILIKNPNFPNVDSILKAEIVDTAGVDTLLEYNSSINSRERLYSITFKYKDIYGNENIITTSIL